MGIEGKVDQSGLGIEATGHHAGPQTTGSELGFGEPETTTSSPELHDDDAEAEAPTNLPATEPSRTTNLDMLARIRANALETAARELAELQAKLPPLEAELARLRHVVPEFERANPTHGLNRIHRQVLARHERDVSTLHDQIAKLQAQQAPPSTEGVQGTVLVLQQSQIRNATASVDVAGSLGVKQDDQGVRGIAIGVLIGGHWTQPRLIEIEQHRSV